MSENAGNSHTGAGPPGFTAGASVYASRQRYVPARSGPGRAVSPPGTPERRLRPYDPRWPRIFAVERRRIQARLGPLAQAIEHVGSSSIPGLAGRAEIDVLVGVRGDDAVDAGTRLLTSLGYVTSDRASRGEDPWSLLARAGPIPFELLIVEHGGALWKRHLSLRDYLRGDRARAAQYERSKAQWAARYGADTMAYKLAKRRFWAAVSVATAS